MNLKPSNYTQLINTCYQRIKKDIIKTPLELNTRLSQKYNTNIYFKREDLQNTRSFKLRGALNKIINNQCLSITTASAGNHAQGVAYACNRLQIQGHIFVPKRTPLQKINRIKYYGGKHITIYIKGETFNDALDTAIDYSTHQPDTTFVHPYDDDEIINGQATIAYEIYNEIIPDIIVTPIGGGGLIAGISKYSKNIKPKCDIIGVEPTNADSMKLALRNGQPTFYNNIDTFVDGASVSLVGNKPFKYCSKHVDKIYNICNGNISNKMIDVYQNDGIILEPAGALSLGIFDKLKIQYKNLETKNIVCILSGGNNDISRYNEIIELNQQYLNVRYYFIIQFSQKPGELRVFINDILGEDNDIIRFEYIKKTNGNYGNVLLGIEVPNKHHYSLFIKTLTTHNIIFTQINKNDNIYKYIV